MGTEQVEYTALNGLLVYRHFGYPIALIAMASCECTQSLLVTVPLLAVNHC